MILVISATSSFMALLLEVRVKNTVIAEVEQQGDQIVQQITQVIRNAEGITAPAVGASASSLTLDVITSGDDPTVFDLSVGQVRVTEGVATSVNLNSSRLVVTNLVFNNNSFLDTPGIVTFSFDADYYNPSDLREFNYSATFNGSAALR